MPTLAAVTGHYQTAMPPATDGAIPQGKRPQQVVGMAAMGVHLQRCFSWNIQVYSKLAIKAKRERPKASPALVTLLPTDLDIRTGCQTKSHEAHEDDSNADELDFHGETLPRPRCPNDTQSRVLLLIDRDHPQHLEPSTACSAITMELQKHLG